MYIVTDFFFLILLLKNKYEEYSDKTIFGRIGYFLQITKELLKKDGKKVYSMLIG